MLAVASIDYERAKTSLSQPESPLAMAARQDKAAARTKAEAAKKAKANAAMAAKQRKKAKKASKARKKQRR
ncbi:MAG: hypothetical protein VYC39_11090 [Myxococcota bacterium]|nr:hypothetical protein [Myxococcota bacterium]